MHCITSSQVIQTRWISLVVHDQVHDTVCYGHDLCSSEHLTWILHTRTNKELLITPPIMTIDAIFIEDGLERLSAKRAVAANNVPPINTHNGWASEDIDEPEISLNARHRGIPTDNVQKRLPKLCVQERRENTKR